MQQVHQKYKTKECVREGWPRLTKDNNQHEQTESDLQEMTQSSIEPSHRYHNNLVW